MHVLLTLDLNHVSDSKKRDLFDKKLAELKWTKFRDKSTTWRASFKEDVTAADCVRITKDDVAKAATAAGIASYEAVCHVGPSRPTEF